MPVVLPLANYYTAGAMKKPVLLGAVLLLAALSADKGYCTDESCSELAESSDPWTWLQSLISTVRSAGSFMPYWDDILSTIQEYLTKIKDTVVYNINKKALQFWNILSTIQKYLTKIKDTIVRNINKKAKEVYEKLEDFADRVRTVFYEEFGSFIGELKNTVEYTLLILGLIILCPAISYIIWRFSFQIGVCNALMWILLFNCSVLLTYGLMGPKWVYYIFGTVVWYTWDILSYIWTYPYISAGVIFVVFVGNIAWSIYGRCKGERRENMQTDMLQTINARLEEMENINARLEEMENINARLEEMENINARLEKMENINHDRLQKMEKKQDEILKLLKKVSKRS